MKKLVTLILVLVGIVGTASADDTMYIVGNAPFGGWHTYAGTEMTDNGDGTFTYEFTPESSGTLYFCFASALTAGDTDDWDAFNPNSYRPTGSSSKTLHLFEKQDVQSEGNYGSSFGYNFTSGTTYIITIDKTNNRMSLRTQSFPNLYLRSNLDATAGNSYKTWNADLAQMEDYKFVCTGYDLANSKLSYAYTVTLSQIQTMMANGETEFYFRTEQEGDDFQVGPYSDDNVALSFSDGKNSNNNIAWSNNSTCTDGNGALEILHSTYGASSYTINVTVTYADWGRTISSSAIINTVRVTIPSVGKATFSSGCTLVYTGGVSAYLITGANNGSLTTENVIIVPSNTGLYLEGAEGTYDLEVVPAAYAGSTDVSANMLVAGTGAKVPQTDGSGNTNFILTTNKGASATPKFFKVNTDGNTVAVGKAYLQIPSENVGAHEYFWFEDETTGIEAAKAAQKMNGEFFNLAGQRVAQPAKGLYIVNGKKVIMK